MDGDRQIGATTSQMRTAAQGALFVWCNHDLSYPRRLARDLRRDDLKIVSPQSLEGDMLRGMEPPEIILDHALRLTEGQWEGLARLRLYVGRRGETNDAR